MTEHSMTAYGWICHVCKNFGVIKSLNPERDRREMQKKADDHRATTGHKTGLGELEINFEFDDQGEVVKYDVRMIPRLTFTNVTLTVNDIVIN